MSSWRASRGSVSLLGRPIPLPVAWLAGLVFGLSLIAAVWRPLLVTALLVPRNVWLGEVWRLLSWVLIERDPLSLLFACAMIVWFGSDLVRTWGTRSFVSTCMILAVVPAAITCLLALWPLGSLLLDAMFLSVWPLIEGLTIAWGFVFPHRKILLFFMVPVEGRTLVWVTIGLTFLFAIFYGWPGFIPHFVAEALVILWMDRLRFARTLWLRARLALYERELRRRAGHLRVVRRDDDRPRWTH
jgi:membrane associated rhomboid family serine protease